MLTPITWWGGLLFWVWLLCYRITLRPSGANDAANDTSKAPFPWFAHLTFLSCGLVLAGYFYTLAQPALQVAYTGTLALAIGTVVTAAFQEWRERRAATDTKDGLNAAVQDGEGEDEDDGPLLTAAAYLLQYGPLLLPCLLGSFKVQPWLQGWLA